MIAEKPACLVAYDHIGILLRATTGVCDKHFVVGPEARAGARDLDELARNFGATGIVEHEISRAALMPRGRRGVYEVAHRVIGLGPQPQEEPGREAGRASGIGLRLVLVGENGVEN